MTADIGAPRRDAHLVALPLADAELWLWRDFLPAEAADRLLQRLSEGLRWEQPRLRLFGREHPTPRLSAWIGDPAAVYRYSRRRFVPDAWPPWLLPVRAQVEAACGECFNSVLANYYRDGSDRMGWHADDEPELGPAPAIASLSLGAERRFLLRHRAGGRSHAFALPHGSLLLMTGSTQQHYRHALPSTARPCAARINLTFRRIRAD